jgi:formiminoglutamase
MSPASSSAAAWSTELEPVPPPLDLVCRPDDPRLGELIECWHGDPNALTPGRPVLIGFPQDEGIRRNFGRPGAAAAPNAIRQALYRLTPFDAARQLDLKVPAPLDAGNVRITGPLEESQRALAAVVASVLTAGAIPIVLGGGHETALGHYLGYTRAGRPVGIINLDAHLDVRPTAGGQGHSGSPFRQALEHSTTPLPGRRYVCLGAEPSAVAREHVRFVADRGGCVHWAPQVRGALAEHFQQSIGLLASDAGRVYVSVDADVVAAAEVPGVSAPNPAGLSGWELISLAELAGASPAVSSFEIVEINPMHDRDGQSVRWAALLVWRFLCGLALRRSLPPAPSPPASEN